MTRLAHPIAVSLIQDGILPVAPGKDPNVVDPNQLVVTSDGPPAALGGRHFCKSFQAPQDDHQRWQQASSQQKVGHIGQSTALLPVPRSVIEFSKLWLQEQSVPGGEKAGQSLVDLYLAEPRPSCDCGKLRAIPKMVSTRTT